MKKLLTVLLSIVSLSAGAKNMNEKMEVFDLNNCKLHVFSSQDAMGDVSLIIEGNDELVILEQPAFYESIAEFNDYVKKLGKPVAKVIADYHTAGLADYPDEKIVMVEGMPEFEKGEIYGGMLKNFEKIFEGSMDLRDHGYGTIVPAASTQKWAGVEFVFSTGASSDFPASSILIDGKAYYTHFTPAKAHFGILQISNSQAIDATLNELRKAKESGSTIFVGGHGGVAGVGEVNFQIEYLKKMNELLDVCDNPETFTKELTSAYPSILGEEGLTAVAEALYK